MGKTAFCVQYICNREFKFSWLSLRQTFLPDSTNRQSKSTKPGHFGQVLTQSCGCHHRAWPLFQDDQTQSVSDFDFMITAFVYLFHQYFFFCLNWHIYSTCLFIPQFKTSPYPWVWISWILQRIGWIREYHCIPIIRPEPILVIYLCALMWLRYKVSFIPHGCLWVRLRYSFFRSNSPLTEVKKKKKSVSLQRCGEKQP